MGDKNLKKAQELKSLVEQWVDSRFNFIQVNVYEKMADGNLFENIRNPSVEEACEDYCSDCLDKAEREDLAKEAGVEVGSEDFLWFVAKERKDSIQDYISEKENYPMWNTLFEFKSEPPAEWVDKAVEAGFGIIEGMDDFNTTLFVHGCGYSFYGAHWIPLYLACFEDEAKKYKGVKFDMM